MPRYRLRFVETVIYEGEIETDIAMTEEMDHELWFDDFDAQNEDWFRHKLVEVRDRELTEITPL